MRACCRNMTADGKNRHVFFFQDAIRSEIKGEEYNEIWAGAAIIRH